MYYGGRPSNNNPNKILQQMDDHANAMQDPSYYKKEVQRLRQELNEVSEMLFKVWSHISNKDFDYFESVLHTKLIEWHKKEFLRRTKMDKKDLIYNPITGQGCCRGSETEPTGILYGHTVCMELQKERDFLATAVLAFWENIENIQMPVSVTDVFYDNAFFVKLENWVKGEKLKEEEKKKQRIEEIKKKLTKEELEVLGL